MRPVAGSIIFTYYISSIRILLSKINTFETMNCVKLLCLFLLLNNAAFCQDEQNEEEDNSTASTDAFEGFHAGFCAGAFFPDDYAASLYDGYGVDASGNRNNFINSVMYQRMRYFGLDSSYSDQIGPAIGVTNRDQWYFNESDMPRDVKYNIAFLFGLDLQYGLSKTDGIILNINFAKLTVTGTFTINRRDKIVNPSLGDSVLYFGISGQEQRLMLQLGYCRLLGAPARFNFLIEGGLLMNSARFLNNYAQINSLRIDLTPFTYNQGYQDNYLPVEYNAIGFGAFGGFGFNLNMNPKYIIQVIYSPSFEKINTGPEPEAKLQQSAALRVYYNF
jgi:hypothetical protein